jgi:hypothetical protein
MYVPFISAKTALDLALATAEETSATADRDENQGHHHAHSCGHSVIWRRLLFHQFPARKTMPPLHCDTALLLP